MTVTEIQAQLAALRDDKTYAYNARNGVGDTQYGVKLGDLRKVAKKVKINHSLALELWQTGIFDEQMLAILIMDPRLLSAADVNTLVHSHSFERVADWLNAYIIKDHPENEALQAQWMNANEPMAARAGWNLTSIFVSKKPHLLDIPALLERLENEMGEASPLVQWTMNFTLAEIGIHHPAYRKKALEIGEKLGVYKDYPVSKGCTSPYAPIWINEMVKRGK